MENDELENVVNETKYYSRKPRIRKIAKADFTPHVKIDSNSNEISLVVIENGNTRLITLNSKLAEVLLANFDLAVEG